MVDVPTKYHGLATQFNTQFKYISSSITYANVQLKFKHFSKYRYHVQMLESGSKNFQSSTHMS